MYCDHLCEGKIIARWLNSPLVCMWCIGVHSYGSRRYAWCSSAGWFLSSLKFTQQGSGAKNWWGCGVATGPYGACGSLLLFLMYTKIISFSAVQLKCPMRISHYCCVINLLYFGLATQLVVWPFISTSTHLSDHFLVFGFLGAPWGVACYWYSAMQRLECTELLRIGTDANTLQLMTWERTPERILRGMGRTCTGCLTFSFRCICCRIF